MGIAITREVATNAIRSRVASQPAVASEAHGPDLSLLRLAAETCSERAATAYVIGGYLRDVLLGRRPKDIDLAIHGDALAVARALAERLNASLVPLDTQRGILRVVPAHDDPRLHMDLTPLRQPITAELGRRDFTVNAMAAPLDAFLRPGWRHHLIDPVHGLRDLELRLLRCTRVAALDEDPLRLLRAVRLASALEFHIHEATRKAIRRRAGLLPQAASERLRDEFLQLLAQPNAHRWVRLMDTLGLLEALIPELGQGRGVEQPREHHWDVLSHNIETVGAVELLVEARDGCPEVREPVPWDDALAAYFAEPVSDGHSRATLVKLAGLLHDVAKPHTKTVERGGRIRFYGHPKEGAAMAGKILRRLRLSRRGTHEVQSMVAHHLRPGQMSQGAELPTPRAMYRYFRDLGDAAVATLFLNLADYLAARGPKLVLEDWRRHVTMVAHIFRAGLESQAPQRPLRLVNGHDLMRLFHLQPGPILGRLLEAVEEARVGGEVHTREEALALVHELIQAELAKVESRRPNTG